MMERVVLTTGGTGGHIFPALAVAEELRARHAGMRILFMGGLKGPEGRMAQEAGLEFVGLPSQGVVGRGIRGLPAMLRLLRSVGRAGKELGRFQPQAVLGLGGYASLPSLIAALMRRIPVLIHEQNSVPGVANRFCGRFGQKILLSFPDEKKYFYPGRTVMTGNPVRKSIRELADQPAKEPGRNVLVLGGSQGAKAVNTAVVEALPELLAAGVQVLHQTGEADLERTREGYRAKGANENWTASFINDMASAYAWADLVVCRAGATTVAELAVAGKPSVFIPFPYATHDHQRINARHLQSVGAALLLDQNELQSRSLAGEVLPLLDNPERLAAMARAAKSFGRPDAAAAVADALEAAAKG